MHWCKALEKKKKNGFLVKDLLLLESHVLPRLMSNVSVKSALSAVHPLSLSKQEPLTTPSSTLRLRGKNK